MNTELNEANLAPDHSLPPMDEGLDLGPLEMTVENLNLWYAQAQALKNIDMQIAEKKVTAFIGPSGCGKSTLLRCFNRLNDLIDICHIEGSIKCFTCYITTSFTEGGGLSCAVHCYEYDQRTEGNGRKFLSKTCNRRHSREKFVE